MKKRLLIPLLLSNVLVLGACGNSSSVSEDTSSVSEDTSNPTVDTENGVYASENPLEMSIFMHFGDKFAFDEDWLVFDEIGKKTNITLTGTASKNATNSAEAFNLMMASNKIPDIVHSRIKDFNQYGEEGAFISLNDLIDEHAPNIKKFLEENEDVRKGMTSSEGDIYGIPLVSDGKSHKGWFMRTDWLEKLGLEVPETTEDYYKVLKAFKTQDPNGNGKNDEVPYASRGGVRGMEYFTDLMYLWGAYDALFLEDGEIKYGPLEEEYAIAVDNLTQWYKEGLIDPEIFTRGTNSIVELAGNNTLGATHDWFPSTASVNSIYADEIEGFEFKVIPPPTNTNGDKFEESSRAPISNQSFAYAWGISHSNEYPVETIKYMDYFFTEEGRMLMNFGIEGTTYTMENGEPHFTDEILSQGNVPNYLQETYGIQAPVGFQQDNRYEQDFSDPIALEGIQLYNENNYYGELIPPLTFTPEEQSKLNSLETALNTYLDENLQKWVLGSSDVTSDFEDFKQTLMRMGAEEYLEIQNNAYQRYLDL